MTIGWHAHRRPSILPTLPDPSRKTAGVFSSAMKAIFTEPILHQINSTALPFWHAEPDPWDEAVKWIEQNEAAKAEWPWPTR